MCAVCMCAVCMCACVLCACVHVCMCAVCMCACVHVCMCVVIIQSVCVYVERLQSRTELTTLRKQLQEATKTSEDSSEVSNQSLSVTVSMIPFFTGFCY